MATILIPPPRIPVIDQRTGMMAQPWYAFFTQFLQGLNDDVASSAVDLTALTARVLATETDITALETEDQNIFVDLAMTPDNGAKIEDLRKAAEDCCLDGLMIPDRGAEISALSRRLTDAEAQIDAQPDQSSRVSAIDRRVTDLEVQSDAPADQSSRVSALERRITDLEAQIEMLSPGSDIGLLRREVSDLGIELDMAVDPPRVIYEEGSWTPAIGGSGTAGTQTYSVQLGRYIRINNIVHFWCRTDLSAKDAATAGNLQITGLPYAATTLTNFIYSCAVARVANMDLTAGYTVTEARINSNSSIIALGQNGDNVAFASLAAAALQATTAICISGTYRIN